MNEINQKSVTEAEVRNEKLMSVMCYLSILVIVPFLMAKDQPNVKFHIKQGLTLVSVLVIAIVLRQFIIFTPTLIFIEFIALLFQLIYLAVLILSIIGIVNVLQDKQQPLPLVGQFSEIFKI